MFILEQDRCFTTTMITSIRLITFFYGKGRLNGTYLKNKHDWLKVNPNGFSPLYKYTKHENNLCTAREMNKGKYF